MKKSYNITCIICPIGCKAKVVFDEGKIVSVGNIECPRGETYATKEMTAPLRDFFTTVKVEGASVPVMPVRTNKPIPKDKMMDCALELAEIVVTAPVQLGF